MTDGLRAALQQTLGDGYTLERELGGGGMSRVFVARENALGRDVVVKVLAPELSASVSAERFTREIATAARLQQANIVPVLAAGTSGGVPYYTMPFVTGESLRAQMTTGSPLSMHDRVAVLRDVARALAYAHAQGVVHRDIKPENILLSGGAAVVTDFGIAKAISAARTSDGARPASADGTLTQVGSSVGTPAYMAPEQAVGEQVNQRADLYAWGVVAYELRSGAHPFAGRTGAGQLIAAHIAEEPTPLAVRAPAVPAAVAALVMQCLAKDPAERPDSASALLERLTNVVIPHTATVDRRQLRVSHIPRRARTVGAAALVLMLVVWTITRQRATPVSTSSTSTAAADTTATVRALVVLPFESVGGDTANAYFAEGMADELSIALTKVPGLQLTARSSAAAFRGKGASVQAIGKALNVGGVLEGTVRRAGGKLRVTAQLTNASTTRVIWSEQYERDATDVFAVQDDIARAIVSALRVTLNQGSAVVAPTARGTSSLAAYDLYQRGMFYYARRGRELVRARASFEAAIRMDPKFARAYAGLALTWLALPIYTEMPMRSALPHALIAGRRAVELDSAAAEGWIALGLAHTHQHQWHAADLETARAVQLDPGNASAWLYRQGLLSAIGRPMEAADAARQAVAINPMSVGTLGHAVGALSTAGQHADVTALSDRAWEIDSTLGVPITTSLLALLDGGNRLEARRRAEVVLRSSPQPQVLARAAYVIGASGDTARASAIAKQLTARFAGSADGANSLGAAWLGVGDTARALTLLERAAETIPDYFVLSHLGLRMYDPLRASPRFAAIVRTLGLDVAVFTSPTGGRPR